MRGRWQGDAVQCTVRGVLMLMTVWSHAGGAANAHVTMLGCEGAVVFLLHVTHNAGGEVVVGGAFPLLAIAAGHVRGENGGAGCRSCLLMLLIVAATLLVWNG